MLEEDTHIRKLHEHWKSWSVYGFVSFAIQPIGLGSYL